MGDHRCHYGLTLCTAADLCSHCERKVLKALVRELVESLRTVAWRSKIHLIDCGCVDCDRAEELITRADVKAIMEAPA